MTSSFIFETILPTAEWQNQALDRFRAAPNSTTRDTALTEIVEAFTPYVRLIARSWWRRFGRIRGDDGLREIESAGRHGLLISAHRWQPVFGKPFAHLAGKWIAESAKGEAARLAEGMCRLPPRVRMLCTEFRQLREVGAAASEAFLASSNARQKTKLLVRVFAQTIFGADLSLDASVGEGDDTPLIAGIADAQLSIPDAVQRTEFLERVRFTLMAQCSSRERLIFYLRFPDSPLRSFEVGEVLTKQGDIVDVSGIEPAQIGGRLNRIATVLGLTRERVRQLHCQTMGTLRTHLGRA